MQLYLSQPQPTTEDIKIKMSSQIESLVKSIVEIKEVNQAFKSNEETIAALEKSLSDEPSAADISKDISFIKEKGQEYKTDNNCNGDCSSEDCVKENDIKESTDSIVPEIITNGTYCAQEAKESEFQTQNLEMTKEDGLVTNKTIDSELCLPNNNSENIEYLTKDEEKPGLLSSDKVFFQNDITLREESKDITASININAPLNSLESAKDIPIDSDINKEIKEQVIENAVGSRTEQLNHETEDVESATIDDSKYPDDVEMGEDIHKLTEDPVNILTNKEDITMREIDSSDKVVLSIVDPKAVNMDVGILPPNQTNENIISPEIEDPKYVEVDNGESLSIQTSNSVTSPGTIHPKPWDENEISLPPYNAENVKLPNSDNLETNIMDVEVLSLVQADENVIVSKPESGNSIEKEILLSDYQNSNSDQCTVEVGNKEETNNTTVSNLISTLVSVSADNIKKLNDTSEISLNNIQETDAFLVHSTNICEENKILVHKKNIHRGSMELDQIVISSVEKQNLEEISENKIGTTSNEQLNENTMLESTKPKVTSEVTAEQTHTEDVTVEKQLEKNDDIDNKTELEIVSEKKITENILSTENIDTCISVVEHENTCDDSIEKEVKDLTKEDQENVEVIDEDDVKIVDLDETTESQGKEKILEQQEMNTLPVVCKLSNTLDILSDDDEEEASNAVTNISQKSPEEKQCINLDDDDDIMLIEEDLNPKDKAEVLSNKEDTEQNQSEKVDVETGEKETTNVTNINEKGTLSEDISTVELELAPEIENKSEAETKVEKPLLPQNFLKTAKKNLASMTRHELEDFCILRIVESIVDRSNLSDIKTKMKTMAQNLEDYKKRAMMMTKQNRDLQVVLKSVQEEQKKRTNTPIQPLKITRSVGMQVLMNDKLDPRRKTPIPTPAHPPAAGPTVRPVRGAQNVKQIKPPAAPANIPVPRKVPVINSPSKPITNTPTTNAGTKSASPNLNGLRNPSPVQKAPEKRTHSRLQASSSVTVDLTDDEPPAKMNNNNKNSTSQPVRVVPPQNLLAQQRQFPPINSNARKVYIPISGPQAQQIRAGQTYVMKNVPSPVPRPAQRLPIPRPQLQSPIRPKQTPNRHPAPLPESMKQYTPSTWKALPPAPDLKLSKVENGIVISWKIDGYPEGGYETIASYQLYAYQETTAPPCTALWKKIGDVKALPLPMACTLTQFMAGFKYYFAVRAVDVRSRLGPFSLPGSILLLNKV